MKKIILLLIKTICKVFKLRPKYIIFESFPECDGSPWMIYSMLKKMNYEKKYQLIWAVDKSFQSCNEPNFARFGNLSFFDKVIGLYIQYRAKLIVDSNRAVKKANPESFRIFTRHGGPLKKCLNYMHTLGEMDYMLTLSDELKQIDYDDCKNFSLTNINQIIPLGFPANDRLFEKIDLWDNGFYFKHIHEKRVFKKTIGWLPTFRQHHNKDNSSSTNIFPFGIPLIKTECELNLLNDVLKKENILLAIQMHHAQSKNFEKFNFSNIILISQEIKYMMNVSTANLMNSFDALVTDYSAAYHEYILLNRPIALSIDDFEEYSSKTGFCFDYFDWIKGDYLKSVNDLILFIQNISFGKDSTKKEREKALHRIHKYVDNQSTKRVVQFLINEVQL